MFYIFSFFVFLSILFFRAFSIKCFIVLLLSFAKSTSTYLRNFNIRLKMIRSRTPRMVSSKSTGRRDALRRAS